MRAGSFQLRLLGIMAIAGACSIIACGGGGAGTSGSTAATTPLTTLGLIFPVTSLTATQGEPINPAVVPVISGVATSITATPALPDGILLDPTTGAISGTPTKVQDPADYTIVGSGGGASSSFRIRIGVRSQAPSALTYPWATIVGTVGRPIATATPTVSGTITSYASKPALPPGILLDPKTGTLSGTPTAPAAAAAYSIIASNGTGEATATLTISVAAALQAPTSLAYAQATLNATVGMAITPDLPTVSGTVTTYSVSPALPAGLSLNATTGIVAGTPTTPSPSTAYTVEAINEAGYAATTLTIAVNASLQPPTAFYYATSSITGVAGQSLTPAAPTVTGQVTNYAIDPALPAGLSLNSATGILAGTPTAASPATTYQVTATNAAGSATTSVTVTILNAPPTGLAYAQPTLQAVVGTAILPDAPTVTGQVTSYAIAPALPSGLVLDPATGILSGTPGAASAATIYTVTASNASGSTTTTVSISVQATLVAPANLSYPQSTVTITLGAACPALVPTVTGSVSSYVISPALPAGLVLSSTTGVISGTPTVASTSRSYTVTASNAAGNTSTTLTLAVQLAAPTALSYPQSTVAATLGQAITAMTPTVQGTVTAYACSPTLPAGISLNATTGVLSGTPTVASASTTYTVTASNAIGSTSTTLTLSVQVAPPVTLSYPQSTVTATVGQAITALTPTVQGTVTAFTCSPTLPAGISLNAASGVLSGTPTAASASKAYTITASNATGSASTTLTLTVQVAAPTTLSYPQSTVAATVGQAITSLTPTVQGTVTAYTCSPTLPAGISLNAATGVLSGTPTAASASATYTITASNATGSTSTTLTLSVQVPAPTTLSYPQSTVAATVGQAITSLTPTVQGTVTAYACAPTLPAGLSLNTATGVLSGTPTVASASKAYTVTASNATGSTSTTLTLAVLAAAPSGLTYAQPTLATTIGQAILADTPTVTGAVTSYTASPALPAGISLNATTGVISGTPTTVTALATYNITASNATGSTSTTVNISVAAALAAPTGLTYSKSTLTAFTGQAITTLTPTVTGTVSSYTVSPSLPAGLALNATTGALSGTPSVTSASTLYTITASNATGSTTASLTIVVQIPAPTGLSYAQATLAASVGTAITPDSPTVTGTVSSYTVLPALPAGLALNASTGVLSGTPTAGSASTAYTITAINSTGSTTATVTISVTALQPPTSVTYTQQSFTATVGTAFSSGTPTVSGTATSFTITPSLPSGLTFSATTGAISGTASTAYPSTSYTVYATNSAGSISTTFTLAVVTGGSGSNNVPGFMGLFQSFPSSAMYASSKTTAAMAANSWMAGARFWLGTENLCQSSGLALSTWNGDAANVSGYTNPMSEIMIRLNADPSATWNIQDAASIPNMDKVIAGAVSVGTAAKTTSYMIDAENYSTTYLMWNYNQTSGGSPILNSPTISRSAMCAKMRAFGKAVGDSLWTRVPNAKLYLFFGSTVVLQWTNGGTGTPSSFPDANYAGDSYYNMLPYFCLGLLDACPTDGRIVDYIETSYYNFSGLAALQRNMNASKNWVNIFFPTETAAATKAQTCWVPVPLLFANPYLDASYGTIYPGAYYVTNATDQINYFTRNALYCLQQTPAGYMPGLYVENYDPWGLTGSVTNMPATWQNALKNAMAVYKGTITLDSLFNSTTLYNTLKTKLAGNPAWAAECQ